MLTSPQSTDQRIKILRRAIPTTGRQKNAGRRLAFDRGRGFWLGGLVLGTAGCAIGAAFPYEYPASIVMSMLWWGIYVGVPGAWLGAMLGMLVERLAAVPTVQPEFATNPPVVHARMPARPSDPADRLRVTTRPTADGLLIRIEGVAGVNQSDVLETGLLVASALRPAVVTLDLSDLHFICSLAMGVLVTYRASVVRAGGTIRLHGPLRSEVRAALERSRLLALFERPMETATA